MTSFCNQDPVLGPSVKRRLLKYMPTAVKDLMVRAEVYPVSKNAKLF
jgi:hypothetical protein